MYFFAYFIRKYIAIVESNPPEKLIAAAVAPLVIKANPLFTAVIIRAWEKPRLPAANIVIRFEKPGFAPGGINGRGGIRFSKKLRATAWAQSTAVSAIL